MLFSCWKYDVLLQSYYVQQGDVDTLGILVQIYRNEERKVIYHNRKSGILHLVRQTEKIVNTDFIEKIISNRIQIIY